MGQLTAWPRARRRHRGGAGDGGVILGLGRICVRPPAIHRHADRGELLGRCGSAAYAVALWPLPALEPYEPQLTLPIRLQLSDGRVYRRACARTGPAAAHRRPSAVLRTDTGAQHAPAADLFTPRRTRRSRVQLVGT